MKKLAFVLLILAFTLSCKEVYKSPVISPETGYLVVDGVINSGSGLTDIALSRTVALDSRSAIEETGATVVVKSEDNIVFPLIENKKGHYSAENLNINAQKKYRLSIKTKAGKEYLSDLLIVKNNPAIDSVSWKKDTTGLSIQVHSHDDLKKTNYYQWQFEETWELNAEYKTYIQYKIDKDSKNNDKYSVEYRDQNSSSFYQKNMYFCWKSNVSSEIHIGSTVKLSKDEMHYQLLQIPKLSNKLKSLYSILVKQYALSKEAFSFMEIMKKNTELTGSIFDPQPSVLYGNIHAINDPEEPVIGYISICPIREKRIFISYEEVKPWNIFSSCEKVTVSNNHEAVSLKAFQGYLPMWPLPSPAPFPAIIQFFAAPSQCVDCRILGTNDKPNYWPAQIE